MDTVRFPRRAEPCFNFDHDGCDPCQYHEDLTQQIEFEHAAADVGKQFAAVRSSKPTLEHVFSSENSGPPEFSDKLRTMLHTRKSLSAAKGHLRIVLLTPPFTPEIALGKRLVELLAERGCECCICEAKLKDFVRLINPTILLSMWPMFSPPKKIPAVQFWGNDFPEGSEQFSIASKYRYFLHGTPDVAKLAGHAARSGKQIRAQPLLLSVRASAFCDSPKRRLFFSAIGWDRRRGKLYLPIYSMLDKTGYFDAYGNSKLFPHGSYRGSTNNQKLFLERMREAGVALVLHGDDHLNNGTSSSRVFEAAASSCVIISDRHPFIVENFGDSVLYIDQNASPKEIFGQIDGHMRWILANPDEAIELARRSHEIFVKNFSLENEADKIEKFFREIVAENAAP
ncbi:MAG: hypothetical protein LBB38_00495 [Puniceicoccales bacterium]|nr:hypothetical protein [Puniceicoccales bacterium]